MTGNEHITPEVLASLAMQGLPIEESVSLKAHLASCAECRQALSEVLGDLALVGFAVEQQPLPEGARQRFLDKIGSSEPKPGPVAVPPAPRRGPAFWIPWSAVAGLAVACIGLGFQNRALNDELDDEAQLVKNLAGQASRAQQVLEVLTAPGAERVTLTQSKAPAEPLARATYLPERGGLILIASDLKPVPENKTYQLWVIPVQGAPVPAGLFRPDAKGSATLVLPHLTAGITAKALAVTIEDAAGASTPTMPIVLSGAAGGS